MAPPDPERRRPRVRVEPAAAGRSWHVRLAEPWLAAMPGATMGVIYQGDDRLWHGRYYPALTPDPSIDVGRHPEREVVVHLIIDAWCDSMPPVGGYR